MNMEEKAKDISEVMATVEAASDRYNARLTPIIGRMSDEGIGVCHITLTMKEVATLLKLSNICLEALVIDLYNETMGL